MLASSLVLTAACDTEPHPVVVNDGSPPSVDSGGGGGGPGNDGGSMPETSSLDVPVAADTGRPDTPPVDRPAVVDAGEPWPFKFCHTLTDADGKGIEVAIEIGQPPVRLTASTGGCAPALGMMCPRLPAGPTPYTLYQGARVLHIGRYNGAPGRTQVLTFAPDESTPSPGDVLQIMTIANEACETLDPSKNLPRAH